MADQRCNSRAWPPLGCAVLLFAVASFLAPTQAAAEILVDDFDDPVHVSLPELENVHVETPGIGDLNALRRVVVVSFRTDPLGSLDADLTRSSHLTARIDGQIPHSHPESSPLLSFGTGYEFATPVDLTEGGVNDTVFLDMGVFQGPGFPGAMSLELIADNDTFLAIVSAFKLPSNSPYTLAVPFSAFGGRGGGGGTANFSNASLIGVTVRLLTGNRDPDTKWLVQIDRFRVGRLVPEPASGALLCGAIVIGSFGVRRSRQVSKH